MPRVKEITIGAEEKRPHPHPNADFGSIGAFVSMTIEFSEDETMSISDIEPYRARLEGALSQSLAVRGGQAARAHIFSKDEKKRIPKKTFDDYEGLVSPDLTYKVNVDRYEASGNVMDYPLSGQYKEKGMCVGDVSPVELDAHVKGNALSKREIECIFKYIEACVDTQKVQKVFPGAKVQAVKETKHLSLDADSITDFD